MDLATMFVSQRKLRAPEQVHTLVESVLCLEPIPPVLLSEDDDGSVQVEDGHHRVSAYWLAGRRRLRPEEYLLVARGRLRPRFGRIPDLIARVRALGAALPVERGAEAAGSAASSRAPPSGRRAGGARGGSTRIDAKAAMRAAVRVAA